MSSMRLNALPAKVSFLWGYPCRPFIPVRTPVLACKIITRTKWWPFLLDRAGTMAIVRRSSVQCTTVVSVPGKRLTRIVWHVPALGASLWKRNRRVVRKT